jgi:hypothetical protein
LPTGGNEKKKTKQQKDISDHSTVSFNAKLINQIFSECP